MTLVRYRLLQRRVVRAPHHHPLLRRGAEIANSRKRVEKSFFASVYTHPNGLKCNFKVVGTVKKNPWDPVIICGPQSILQCPQTVILTKFRFSSSVPVDKTIFPA